jgi:hypothetical protein
LTLLRLDSGAVIWRSDPFPRAGPDEIRLALPRHLLSPGAFRLRLHGLRNGRERRLAEYDLRIAR